MPKVTELKNGTRASDRHPLRVAFSDEVTYIEDSECEDEIPPTNTVLETMPDDDGPTLNNFRTILDRAGNGRKSAKSVGMTKSKNASYSGKRRSPSKTPSLIQSKTSVLTSDLSPTFAKVQPTQEELKMMEKLDENILLLNHMAKEKDSMASGSDKDIAFKEGIPMEKKFKALPINTPVKSLETPGHDECLELFSLLNNKVSLNRLPKRDLIEAQLLISLATDWYKLSKTSRDIVYNRAVMLAAAAPKDLPQKPEDRSQKSVTVNPVLKSHVEASTLIGMPTAKLPAKRQVCQSGAVHPGEKPGTPSLDSLEQQKGRTMEGHPVGAPAQSQDSTEPEERASCLMGSDAAQNPGCTGLGLVSEQKEKSPKTLGPSAGTGSEVPRTTISARLEDVPGTPDQVTFANKPLRTVEIADEKECGNTIPFGSSTLSSCHEMSLASMGQTRCGLLKNKNTDSIPTQMIICQYPTMKPMFMKKESPSVFLRMDYIKDHGKQRSLDDRPIKLANSTSNISKPPGKPVRVRKRMWSRVPKTNGCLSDATRVPYVDLGFHCDSPSFVGQQVKVTSSSHCGSKEMGRITKGHKKVMLKLSKKLEDKKSALSKKKTTIRMDRFDYKRDSTWNSGTMNHHARSLSLPDDLLSCSWTGDDSMDSVLTLESSSDSSSACHFQEMALSSMEDSSDSHVNNESDISATQCGDTRNLYKIVNLPIDLVKRNNKSLVLDGDRFLRLLVRRLNSSGFRCRKCGSSMDGKVLMEQLYNPDEN